MSSWDDLMNELEQRDAELAQRVRAANDASGLRKDLKDAKDEARTLRDKAKKYEDRVLASTLKERGINVNPSYLVRPDDMDIADEEQVNKWLTEAGLWKPEPAAPPAELQAHDRVSNLGAGDAAPRTPVDEKKAKLISGQLSEDEFWATADELNLSTSTYQPAKPSR